MSTRFSPNKKKNKYEKVTEPAMVVTNNHYDEESHDDTTVLTKQTSSSSSSKKNKKKGGKQYVMMSTSFESNDDDEDDDEYDQEIDDDDEDNNKSITQKSPLSTLDTTFQNAEDDDDEDHLEDVQLYSPHKPDLVDVDIDDDSEDDTLHEITNGNKQSTMNGKSKHRLSAYYGMRLNYSDKTKCHDIIWALLWIIHCAILIIVLIVVWSSDHVTMPHAQSGIYILLFLLSFAIIFAFIWTFLLKYCGGFIVWVLILGNLIFIFAFSFFCFILPAKFIGLGVVFCVLFVLFLVFTLLIRKKINYTIALLQLGTSILLTTPSALFISFCVLLSQIVWMFIWGSIVVAWMAQYHHTSQVTDFNGILFILIISFIWNHQTIKNIGHTTICAVISFWYFTPAKHLNSASYPTFAALKRCLTTSLGSIAFGSLFVNILQGIRAYLHVLRDYCACCSCLKYTINCCLSGFDGLLEYFNNYAFAHVAIYGTSYLKSGKNTHDLLSMSGQYQLINSNFTEYALLCGSICGGIINGILGTWVANTMHFDVDWVVLFTCGGFMIGMSLSSSMLNAVSSCVTALFVCYAEEPQVLLEMHPEQALRFDGAKQGIA